MVVKRAEEVEVLLKKQAEEEITLITI